MISARPNKQRKMISEASFGKRREMMSAHLSKELRAEYKRRAMTVRKGDEVKVLRGEHSGKAGKVSEIDVKKFAILVDGITLKRTIGTEKQVPIKPSNVVITSLELSDGARQRILLRKVKEVKVPEKKPEPVVEKKEVEAKTEEHKHEEHEHALEKAGHTHDHKEKIKPGAPRAKSAVAKSKAAANATRGR